MTSSTYPTQPQIDYCRDLLNKKDLTASPKLNASPEELPELRANMHAALDFQLDTGRMTRKDLSGWIDRLKTFPDASPQRTAVVPHLTKVIEVPAGRYALRTPQNKNEISFYKIDKPTEGKWAGRTFVSQLIGPERQPIRGSGAALIVSEIAKAGIKESMLLYGKEIGRCGHCGRRLTNDLSREIGIGPICRNGMGW